jgi:hypothetical protein
MLVPVRWAQGKQLLYTVSPKLVVYRTGSGVRQSPRADPCHARVPGCCLRIWTANVGVAPSPSSWHKPTIAIARFDRRRRQLDTTTADNKLTHTALEQHQQVIYPLILLVASRKDGQEESVQVRHPERISRHREINAATPSGSTQDHG